MSQDSDGSNTSQGAGTPQGPQGAAEGSPDTAEGTPGPAEGAASLSPLRLDAVAAAAADDLEQRLHRALGNQHPPKGNLQ